MRVRSKPCFHNPLEFKSLRVVPLVGPSYDDPSYRLFGPEVAGNVEVDEVSAEGSVPNLRVTNKLADRLLLIDGQELIGAKQNRIVNADVLVPASPSAAMADVYREKEQDLSEVRTAFTLPDNTVGVAVYAGERLLGLDLFDRADTLRHHWQSLLDSDVLDWLAFCENPSDRTDEAEQTEPVTPLEELFDSLQQAEWERFDAPGEGDDLRHETDRLTASALAWGEGDARTIVHLQAFPRELKAVAPEYTDAEPHATHNVEQREGEPAGRRCTHCGFLYGLVVTPEGDYCNHCGHA